MKKILIKVILRYQLNVTLLSQVGKVKKKKLSVMMILIIRIMIKENNALNDCSDDDV